MIYNSSEPLPILYSSDTNFLFDVLPACTRKRLWQAQQPLPQPHTCSWCHPDNALSTPPHWARGKVQHGLLHSILWSRYDLFFLQVTTSMGLLLICSFFKPCFFLFFYILQHWLTELEVMACLFAAAIHDYEHTGTTNNFHIHTRWVKQARPYMQDCVWFQSLQSSQAYHPVVIYTLANITR